MTLGAKDKKKVVFLTVLGLILAWVMYSNLFSGPDTPVKSSAPRASENPIIPVVTTGPLAAKSMRSRARSGDGFHPTLGSKKGDEKNRIDPFTIDPTLRRDRLEAVQGVDLEGGSRNIFQFGTPPPPKADLPKGAETKVVPFVGPRKPAEPTPPGPPPPPPPPPPIPLKFYAFWVARDNGRKTACFLDGEDIVMAAEGETLKRRYRVIRINPTSVVMEDLDVKKQQTLPIVEEAASQGE
jgi:hypothetical protein